MLFALHRSMHFLALKINYFWAWVFFTGSFIPVRIEGKSYLKKNAQFILCANHFSYLDIPALALLPISFKFVGKSQLSKVPLFGFMYNRIHITVNRENFKSRASSLTKALKEATQGFNLGFFPEGGIKFQEFPQMVPFKDGAFKVAIEKDLPIIPVTFPDNYFILKDDQLFSMTRRTLRIIVHEPVQTHNKNDMAVRAVRGQVFNTIQQQLSKESSNFKKATLLK